MRFTAACTGACPGTCAPSRISIGRSFMPRGSRSTTRPTAGAWSLRANCPRTCSACSTNYGSRFMETVFRGRVFSVETGDKLFPNGRTHRVEIVRHSPSVVLIPIEDDGRVVLIKQFRPPLDREIWEFPAGRVDGGESADAAARRECEEEIGRVPHAVERLHGLYPTPGSCDEELIFFRVADLRPRSTGAPQQ